MSLLSVSKPIDQVKSQRTFRSQEELDMRESIDRWGRARWPGARVVHELVMNRGTVRADMAFVSEDHLVSIEIKSGLDVTDRLLTQVAMFRLATPETWVVVDERHLRDVALVRYLIPTIGVAAAKREKLHAGPFELLVVHEPGPFQPYPEALLSLCWVAELGAECAAARLGSPAKMTHARLVQVLQRLSPAEQLQAVCRQIRGREAAWRADPRIAPAYLPALA